MKVRQFLLSGFLLLASLFLVVPAFSQNSPNEEQGLKPYDSWHGGDLDSISMTTGGLALHIPLASFPQRGALELSFMVRHSTKQWYVKPAKCCDAGGHNITNAQWLPMSNSGTQVVSSVDWWLQGTSALDDSSGVDWTIGVTSPDGNTHNLGGDTNGATSGPTYPLRSFDATGLLFSNSQTLIFPNGTRYTYPNVGLVTGPPPSYSKLGVQATSAVDANGNQISISAGGWTDTMGRVIPGQSIGSSHEPVQPGVPTTDLSTCPAGTSAASVWNVPGIAGLNGGVRTFKFCYSPVILQTFFGVNAPDYGPVSTPLLTAIVLPDLTQWTFAYDSYGDVTRLGFPTGGSISYAYITGPGQCNGDTQLSRWVASRTVDANDGTGGHTWTYTYSAQAIATPIGNGQYQINYSGTTKVTSPPPELNDTVHTVANPVPGAFCQIYDTQVQYFQGSSGTGTLLKTVSTQYNGNVDWSRASGPIASNVVPTQITTTVGAKTNRLVNSFDTGNTVTQNYLFQAATAIPVVFGNVMQRDEYDFSNTLVRSTLNHYLWQDNSTYASNNFITLPVSTILKTGAGCEVAKTSNGYDETYLGITTQPASVSMQHVAPPGAVRGNHTSTSRWLISACAEQSSITGHTIPYDTGLPYQSYDPLAHMTQYTYDPAFYGAYLTQTNLPDTLMPDQGATAVHHIISGWYDFNTGLLTRFTDENSQNFTYSYDIMLRLTQGNHPDGGLTQFTYPDPLTVTRQRLIVTGVYDSYTAKFDGLGRPTQSQQLTPSGTILADTTYDVVGRVYSVSNPYYQGSNHQTDPTYGVTSTQYDALSRTTRTTKQDQSFTTITYTDNCTTVTDESGKSRKSCTDALGRMVSVFEDPAGLNYETDYQYDVLNNLTRVDQKGSAPSDSTKWRTRLFTYDSLSRLITALNPEAGTTCYGIWSGVNCINGYDVNGNLLKKTDARNITITYAYDAINRLTDKTYSDSTPQASYRYDYSSFLGQTFANPIGREVATFVAATTPQYFTSYDPMGRVKNTVQCNPGVTGCKTFTANYDKLGDLTSLVYPGNGFTVNYAYDTTVPNSAARLVSATDSNGVVYASLDPTSQLAYLASGAIREFNSPNFNGNKYHVDYNSRLQPTEIWTGASQGANALFDKQYSYGATGANNGNIFTITNVKDSTRTQTFTYDSLNRLASAQDATHWSNVYTYDAWGNLSKKLYGPIPAGEHLDTSADGNNRLLGYTYDAGGNMTSDGINNWTYVFGAENRITNAGGTIYTYDAEGRRIKKSSGTNYWYGPTGAVLAETDSAGSWTNYIFFGGQRLARNVGGDIKYYVTDHLHSTAVFADRSGALLDDNDFYPWGGVVPGIGISSSTNHYKFSGKERDTESQLDYFGARYYGNVTGRFMSPDWAAKPTTAPYAKFGDPQSLNLYSYVRNSPIVRVDADGHFDDPFGIFARGSTSLSNIKTPGMRLGDMLGILGLEGGSKGPHITLTLLGHSVTVSASAGYTFSLCQVAFRLQQAFGMLSSISSQLTREQSVGLGLLRHIIALEHYPEGLFSTVSSKVTGLATSTMVGGYRSFLGYDHMFTEVIGYLATAVGHEADHMYQGIVEHLQYTCTSSGRLERRAYNIQIDYGIKLGTSAGDAGRHAGSSGAPSPRPKLPSRGPSMINHMISLAAIVTLLASSSVSKPALDEPRFDLTVRITSPKYTYKLSQEMRLEIAVMNHAQHSIYVENYFISGSGGNALLTIADSAGHEVMPADILDAVLPFGQNGELPVVQLKPGYFLGTILDLNVRTFFRRPGKYTLYVTYQSRIRESSTDARPLWDYTKPALKSNVVTITVK